MEKIHTNDGGEVVAQTYRNGHEEFLNGDEIVKAGLAERAEEPDVGGVDPVYKPCCKGDGQRCCCSGHANCPKARTAEE